MKFYCQHRSNNGEQCRQFAMPKRDYCRWHSIPRQYRDYGKSWGKFWGTTSLLIAVLTALRVLTDISQFLIIPEFEIFIQILFFSMFSGFCLGYGMMLLGSSNIVWTKTYAVSLGVMSVCFFVFTFGGLIDPALADLVVAKLYPDIAFSHPLLSISTLAVIAFYLAQHFLSTVMFLPTPNWINILVLAAYLVIWVAMVALSMAPLLPMIFILIFVVYILDSKFHWFSKLFDAFRF